MFSEIAEVMKSLTRQQVYKTFAELWTHNSWRAFFINGGMLVSTTVCAMLAANSCQDEQCSTVARGAAGAMFGLFASGAAVLIPGIKQKNKIKAEAQDFSQQINATLAAIFRQNNPETINFSTALELICKIQFFCHKTLNSLPVNKTEDEEQNLISVKNLLEMANRKMNALENQLNSATTSDDSKKLLQEAAVFWNRDVYVIQDALMAEQEQEAALPPYRR